MQGFPGLGFSAGPTPGHAALFGAGGPGPGPGPRGFPPGHGLPFLTGQQGPMTPVLGGYSPSVHALTLAERLAGELLELLSSEIWYGLCVNVC